MKNKVTLIIPDLHHRWKIAEDIIASVKHDEVIFLGDYFDDFGDDPSMVEATCDWLNSSVKKPNRIHLMGNHDIHYAFVYRSFQCSGYEQWKYFIAHDNVARETWDKLKWYHILDDMWLLSHAGLHKANLPADIRGMHTYRSTFLKTIGNYLDVEIREAFRRAANNKNYWTLNAGYSRGGSIPYGGIIWCDYEREFVPIKGLNQIVGHTPQKTAKWFVQQENGELNRHQVELWTPTTILNDVECSVNLDLDVYRKTHYGVWDGETLSVKCHNG